VWIIVFNFLMTCIICVMCLIYVFQSLMDGLKEVNADLWKDVTNLQAHWIGSCDGVRFEFKLMVCSLSILVYFIIW